MGIQRPGVDPSICQKDRARQIDYVPWANMATVTLTLQRALACVDGNKFSGAQESDSTEALTAVELEPARSNSKRLCDVPRARDHSGKLTYYHVPNN